MKISQFAGLITKPKIRSTLPLRGFAMRASYAGASWLVAFSAVFITLWARTARRARLYRHGVYPSIPQIARYDLPQGLDPANDSAVKG
jgi:hypothetical protein